jgi:hypothetical protein
MIVKLVKKVPHLMETEYSLRCSYETATVLCHFEFERSKFRRRVLIGSDKEAIRTDVPSELSVGDITCASPQTDRDARAILPVCCLLRGFAL